MLCGYEPFYGESDAELVAANKVARVEFPESDWACGTLVYLCVKMLKFLHILVGYVHLLFDLYFIFMSQPLY